MLLDALAARPGYGMLDCWWGEWGAAVERTAAPAPRSFANADSSRASSTFVPPGAYDDIEGWLPVNDMRALPSEHLGRPGAFRRGPIGALAKGGSGEDVRPANRDWLGPRFGEFVEWVRHNVVLPATPRHGGVVRGDLPAFGAGRGHVIAAAARIFPELRRSVRTMSSDLEELIKI